MALATSPISDRIGEGENNASTPFQTQSPVPLYIPTSRQVRALAAGGFAPGDRIPASRELPTMLRCSPHDGAERLRRVGIGRTDSRATSDAARSSRGKAVKAEDYSACAPGSEWKWVGTAADTALRR